MKLMVRYFSIFSIATLISLTSAFGEEQGIQSATNESLCEIRFGANQTASDRLTSAFSLDFETPIKVRTKINFTLNLDASMTTPETFVANIGGVEITGVIPQLKLQSKPKSGFLSRVKSLFATSVFDPGSVADIEMSKVDGINFADIHDLFLQALNLNPSLGQNNSNRPESAKVEFRVSPESKNQALEFVKALAFTLSQDPLIPMYDGYQFGDFLDAFIRIQENHP